MSNQDFQKEVLKELRDIRKHQEKQDEKIMVLQAGVNSLIEDEAAIFGKYERVRKRERRGRENRKQ